MHLYQYISIISVEVIVHFSSDQSFAFATENGYIHASRITQIVIYLNLISFPFPFHINPNLLRKHKSVP